ncbi:hypothetical protein [Jeotgalibaca caeni]|uniref:hypothetical protein n=1 Tax=Jeotgalibaca caeni TaxID=3028623 RepID=UPI00237D8C6D|nr:hypothetical protein [Jeotgalibaca caeni]MDE1549974.1 hypothetical protein [Jeotgalibaca caeni]
MASTKTKPANKGTLTRNKKTSDNLIGLNIKSSEVERLLVILKQPYYHSAFIESNDLHKVMTVFGAKGLEFNQVLSFSSYYNFDEEGKKQT